MIFKIILENLWWVFMEINNCALSNWYFILATKLVCIDVQLMYIENIRSMYICNQCMHNIIKKNKLIWVEEWVKDGQLKT